MPAALITLADQPGSHNKTTSADGSITYAIKFAGHFTEDVTNAFQAESLAGIVKGMVLSFATGLKLATWTTSEDENPRLWFFSCSFQTPANGSGGSNDKPKLLPFNWSEQREKALINTVGDPMPGLQKEDQRGGFKLVWEKSSLDIKAHELAGSVNDTAMTVAGISVPKFCMRAGALEYQELTDGDTTSFLHTLPLYLCFKKAGADGEDQDGTAYTKGDFIGFAREYVSNGYNQILDGNVVEIVLPNGSKPSAPVRLDAAGAPIFDKTLPSYNIIDIPDELDDFSSLNIPSSIG